MCIGEIINILLCFVVYIY